MLVNLILTPETEEDLFIAYAWYEEKRLGLGEEFLRCVDACIQQVRRNPEIHAFTFGSFRRALVRRFPYSVFYEFANNDVVVYCVFHNSREPKKWQDRLP